MSPRRGIMAEIPDPGFHPGRQPFVFSSERETAYRKEKDAAGPSGPRGGCRGLRAAGREQGKGEGPFWIGMGTREVEWPGRDGGRRGGPGGSVRPPVPLSAPIRACQGVCDRRNAVSTARFMIAINQIFEGIEFEPHGHPEIVNHRQHRQGRSREFVPSARLATRSGPGGIPG